MAYPVTEINRLEKVLNAMSLNIIKAKRDLLKMKRHMLVRKDELESLVDKAGKLTKKYNREV